MEVIHKMSIVNSPPKKNLIIIIFICVTYGLNSSIERNAFKIDFVTPNICTIKRQKYVYGKEKNSFDVES